MSVNREFQFLAMLEGHELEKELMDMVGISFIIGPDLETRCFSLIWLWASLQLICSQDKEVGIW